MSNTVVYTEVNTQSHAGVRTVHQVAQRRPSIVIFTVAKSTNG